MSHVLNTGMHTIHPFANSRKQNFCDEALKKMFIYLFYFIFFLHRLDIIQFFSFFITFQMITLLNNL